MRNQGEITIHYFEQITTSINFFINVFINLKKK